MGSHPWRFRDSRLDCWCWCDRLVVVAEALLKKGNECVVFLFVGCIRRSVTPLIIIRSLDRSLLPVLCCVVLWVWFFGANTHRISMVWLVETERVCWCLSSWKGLLSRTTRFGQFRNFPNGGLRHDYNLQIDTLLFFTNSCNATFQMKYFT